MKNARLLGKGASVFIIVILPVVFCLTGTGLYAQAPSANFTANVVSGCSPLIVQFTDQSTGGATSWHWDLGNGSTSSIQNPTATFTTPGSYTITLTATNASGSNTTSKTNYITVNVPPVAKFTSTDTAGCTPHNVVFTDQSTSTNGAITQWEWNFGDGGTSSIQNPSHTYTMSGTFNVYLKVTNASGCTQTLFKQQYIRAGAGASADFIVNTPSYCQAPVTVSFTNNSQTDGTATYQWNFGDGGSSAAVNPTHVYNSYGTFTVTLTMQSADGCNSTKQATVTLEPKNVSFTGPSTICVGTAATFTMTSSPSPVTQSWEMGDGNTASGTSISHTYTSAGTYTVTLINEFPGGCTATKNQTIQVTGGPSIDFKADTTKACKAPFTVNFQPTGAAASGFTWDFGDDSTSNQQNPSHTYQASGLFTVKLTATNATGCVSTIQKNELIRIQPPTLAITNLPINDGCTPYAFSPQANIDAAEGVASYFWDFGNGYTSTNPTPTYTYTTPGSYTIRLRVQTNGGCVDSITYANGLNIGNGMNVDFSAVPRVACVDQPVAFSMSSTNAPESYFWRFGDGDSSGVSSPSHAYKSAKLYTVSLEVKYGNCISRVSKDDYITVSPPEAKFKAVRDCNNKRLINFTDESVGTGSYTWNFGDGGTSNLQNPSHAFASDGTYSVSLTVNNGTCSHTLTKQVQVSAAAIDITIANPVFCKGSDIFLKAVVPNSVNVSNYEWTISNHGTKNTTADSSEWIIYTAGVYDVTLKITSITGCEETITKSGYLTVYGPTADFYADKIGGCLNATINFRDTSVSDGTHPITQWAWEFGDSTTASGTSVSHQYTRTGKFPVTLKVTDSYGCSHSRTRGNMVNITDGKAMFTAIDTMSCRGRNVVFKDTSSGTVTFWEWSFGDGNRISDVQNPAHAYQDSGYYSVKLKIIENSGCADSVTKTNYVMIKDPKASFTLSDTFSTCPPLTVNFYDHSYYAKKWSWDFGDGGGSPVANPTNLYNIPNTYRVKLTVTSPGGCTDTATASIRILGPYGQFTYSPVSGCTPLPVTYNVSSTEAVKFMWDYSDGIVDSGTSASASHNYLSGGRFVPKVILTDVAGCKVPVIGTDTIYIEKTVVDFTADKLAYCDSGNVVFHNISIVNAPSSAYQWNFGDGTSANTDSAAHMYNTPGWYNVTLKATTPLGCVDTLTRTAYIRINNSPVAKITSEDSLCMPATFHFSPTLQPDTSGIKTWTWTLGNGNSSSLRDPGAQVFPSAGSYTNSLYIEDNEGCSTTVNKTIVVHPLPAVAALRDTTICRGDSVQLSVSGAASYTWVTPNNNLSCTNCANPVASPLYDITYKVQGTSALGCVAYDSVTVKVFQPYKISVERTADSLCEGKTVLLKASGAPLYTWSPAAGLSATNISNPVAGPSASTVYRVIGYDNLGCFKDSMDVPIKVLSNPTVNAGPDITLSAGSTATVQSTASPDVVTYTWSPSTGLSCTDCSNPTVTGGGDITYTIKCTNAAGCVAYDQVKILVTCNEANVFVPNTFTPNGDGMNDVFYIRGKGIFAIRSLKIFNRWGELVFDKKDVTPNDPDHGWNGMFRGTMASTDTYVYQLEVLCNNNQSMKYNGTISLVR